MNLQSEILQNLNTRYVLLRTAESFSIVDIKKRGMLIIDDPILNKMELIKAMIAANVEIYDDPKKLPRATEIPIAVVEFPEVIKVFLRRIYDQNAKETGSVITAIAEIKVAFERKKEIENLFRHYAHTVLYPGEGLKFYSDVYADTISLVVIKGINDLPYKDINSEEISLYDW